MRGTISISSNVNMAWCLIKAKEHYFCTYLLDFSSAIVIQIITTITHYPFSSTSPLVLIFFILNFANWTFSSKGRCRLRNPHLKWHVSTFRARLFHVKNRHAVIWNEAPCVLVDRHRRLWERCRGLGLGRRTGSGATRDAIGESAFKGSEKLVTAN